MALVAQIAGVPVAAGADKQEQARQDCEAALQTAREQSQAGRFEVLLQDLLKCEEYGTTRWQQAQSYELQAKAALALDDLEKARAAVGRLIRRNPDFPVRSDDAPLFVDLVTEAKRGLVRSVSKFLEDWRDAPATVVVVTADEILRRGYRDLEGVLHDLPGFDISRDSGDEYATIYQRGYRSAGTDRTLLLVDGVEQNDLHSNVAYLSRQYPLSDVDRLEVVYGPASTIYGPNAFSGVINIITREPHLQMDVGQRVATRVLGGGGSFGTAYVDATMAVQGSGGDAAWSLTARGFRSAEPDLSWSDNWDYGYPEVIDRADYRKALLLEGKALDKVLCSQLAPEGALGDVLSHPERCALANRDATARLQKGIDDGLLEKIDLNQDGRPDIALTDLGVERARRLDRALWETELAGQRFVFSDSTRDWYLSGKLRLSELSLGAQVWEQQEGTTPWYGDWAHGEGGIWVPKLYAFHASYNRAVGREFSVSFLGQYKVSQVSDRSTVPIFATYANGLSILDLLSETSATFRKYSLSQTSTQFKGELSATYEPSRPGLKFLLGGDVRNGTIQADYRASGDASLFSFSPNPTPDRVVTTDLGLFGQASGSFFRGKGEILKVVVGGRYDYNHVPDNEQVWLPTFETKTPTLLHVSGFGGYFSPRIALIGRFGRMRRRQGESGGGQDTDGQRRPLIIKALYSKASQLPSNYERFGYEPLTRQFPSPFLGREEAENFELNVGWEPLRDHRLEVAIYQVNFSDVLHTAIKVDPCCTPLETGQFQSIGQFRVQGVQVVASMKRSPWAVSANYSYTGPSNTGDPKDEYGEPLAYRGESIGRLPIGDIARHKGTIILEIGSSASAGGTGWGLGMRVNAVSARPTGSATTSRLNPESVPGYVVASAIGSYRGLWRDLTLQLTVDNLFNTRYFDPGVRSAQYFGFAGRIPQPGLAAYARVIYEMNGPRRNRR
jgi:outer membrane receptor for ferrienterochelin and colicins